MIRLKSEKPWWFSGMAVPFGEFVVEHVVAAQCMVSNQESEIISVPPPVFDISKVESGDAVLICRVGAFGDLMCVVPLVRQIQSMIPDGAEVAVVCHPRYAPVLEGVVKTLPGPLAWSAYENPLNKVIWLEGAIERPNEGTKGLKYASRMAARAGVRLSNRKLEYALKPEETKWAIFNYPRQRSVRIGIQAMASSANRTYPANRMLRVMQDLIHRGAELVMLGAPGQVTLPEVDNVINTMKDNLRVRQSVAVSATCDALLVPDSLFLHVGGALQIPTLGLFGATDPSVVVHDCPTVETMIGVGGCARCAYLPKNDGDWPHGKLCETTKCCMVIDGLSPDVVAQRVWKLATKGK